MVTFIKTNWFKLGILIMLGVAVFIYSQNVKNYTAPLLPTGLNKSSSSPSTIQKSSIQPLNIPTASSTLPSPKLIVAPQVPPTWHTAFTYTGESSTDTKIFNLPSSTWRVTVTCTPLQQYAGLSASISGGDNSFESEQFGNNECAPSHVYNFSGHTPGHYSLSTIDVNATYSIKIEAFY